jgi:hypothetical protein
MVMSRTNYRTCEVERNQRVYEMLIPSSSLLYIFLDGFCNTPGVYHQLSSGFELKHDRLSGDEGVNVKPMEMRPT